MSHINGEFTFKPLTGSALDEMMDIENDVHRCAWSAQQFLDCFKDDLYLCTGLFKKYNLVGYAVMLVTPPDAEIHKLSIRKDMQSCGLGTLLLTFMGNECINMQLENVYLEVRESNAAAISIYVKSGYQQVGFRKNYYISGRLSESALLYRLKMGQHLQT